MFTDLVSLIYPDTCLNCSDTLLSSEDFVCATCKINLPVTNDHKNEQNQLYQMFAFEPKIKSASAYMYFNQGGIAQKLLHALKYAGKKKAGRVLGRWYAKELKGSLNPSMIVPVPIHVSKEKKRGYNQSYLLSEGLAEVFDESSLRNDLIARLANTKTQTKKSKVERWENVENVYSEVSENLTGQSVLVVDDVITTGATVGMLCDRLVNADVEAIHIACIARGR